jgi:DHA1 family tetracycline resistance protein-like MFS transporter
MTGLVAPTEQGRLQGALSSLMGLASLIGPILFTEVFATSVSASKNAAAWSGSPFLLSALMVAIATLMAWHTTGMWTRPIPQSETAA